MEKLVVESGAIRTCRVATVGGDLRLMGRVTGPLEVRADRRRDVDLEHKQGQVVITCRSDCIIYVPREVRVEIERVGGDARVTDLKGDLLLRAVGGDLNLRNVRTAALETVGGDLGARRVEGNLSVDQVGGDAVVYGVEGDLRLRAVGGDLQIANPQGEVQAVAGGDVRLRLKEPPARPIHLRAGGDLICWLPEGSSAQVHAMAGGALELPGQEHRGPGGATLELGNGEVALDLAAGGDLRLLLIGETGAEAAGLGEALSQDVSAQVLAEIEASMAAVDTHLAALDTDWIEEKVRRAMERARRKVEMARKRGRRKGRAAVSMTWSGRGPAKPSPNREQERLAILHMLEKGQLTVDQAEELLKALEGAE